MKELVKQLESIGQSNSINQHNNVAELLASAQCDEGLLDQVNQYSAELICAIEPQDDQE